MGYMTSHHCEVRGRIYSRDIEERMGRPEQCKAGLGAAGADEMEWAQWSCLPSAREPHYFWCPEGLVYL